MKKKKHFIFVEIISVIFVTVFFSSTSFSEEKETITWLKSDLAPAFILEGIHENQGSIDCIIDIYRKNMHQYNHKILIANNPRIQELLKQGEKVCYAADIITPERKKYSCFSIPQAITYASVLITRTDFNKIFFLNKQKVSLEDLILNKKIRGGFTTQRAYGGNIDKILNKYKNSGNLIFRSGQTSLKGLLEMLKEKRIDFTLGYPWELEYISRLEQKENLFSVKKISENNEIRWNTIHASCPDNEWGRNLIKEINRIILKTRNIKEYINCQTKWFPGYMENDFMQAYKKRVLSVQIKE